jgi:hypothetical protein
MVTSPDTLEPIYNRKPVNDYRGALWRVVGRLEALNIKVQPAPAPLPWEAMFIADMYWVRDEQVRRDLMKFQKELR